MPAGSGLEGYLEHSSVSVSYLTFIQQYDPDEKLISSDGLESENTEVSQCRKEQGAGKGAHTLKGDQE